MADRLTRDELLGEPTIPRAERPSRDELLGAPATQAANASQAPAPAKPSSADAGNIVRYYILFRNYDHGLALHALLDERGLKNRIAPAPRCLQGELTCGMSLLIEEAEIAAVRAVLDNEKPDYHSIAPLADQLRPFRDRFC